MKTLIQATILSLLFVVANSAHALMLSPGGEFTNKTFYPSYNNPDASDVSVITGDIVEELYRSNVGGVEEKAFADSYETTYSNSATDPSDALVSYVLGEDVITDASWMVVKDGAHTPGWYLFDISSWNGTDDIELSNFWLSSDGTSGSISHIAIFSGTASVPAPSTLALFGIAMLGLGFSRRKQA